MADSLVLVSKDIESRIFSLRGVQIILDRDLAMMYGVETRVLKQAVNRNIIRFPSHFMFEVSESEINNMVSQSVIPSKSYFGGSKPYAFTEQGVAMLSTVLKSSTAIKISIMIIDAFIAMRKMISLNIGLIQRIEGVEKKQIETDQKFEIVFNALEKKDTIPSQGIFFDGQVFDAYEFTSKIIRSAKQSIDLIDNYIDETTLTHLAKKKKGVKVLLFTKNISKQLNLDIQKANAQYGGFEAKQFTQSHDRFLIIDNKEVFHLGASLKDLGKKWFAFSKMDKNSVVNILNAIAGFFFFLS